MCKYKSVYDPRRGHGVSARMFACEKALGRLFSFGMETFEYKGQLVICQDRAYNRLLHKRARALKEAGDPNKLHCYICKEYDAPENLYETEKGRYHQACHTKYCREKLGCGSQARDGKCKRGHDIEGVHKNGKRFCKVCQADRYKEWIKANPRSKPEAEKALRCPMGHLVLGMTSGGTRYCVKCHKTKYKEWKQRYGV